jgi:hypothetical protein
VTSSFGEIAAIAFAGEGEAAPLFALLAPDETGVANLVRLEATRDPTIVGEVRVALPNESVDPEAEVDATRVALDLAWDAADDVLWIASPAGLTAHRRAAKH